MVELTGSFLPSPAERELNRRLLAQNMEFLLENPDWVPENLTRWPEAVVRLHNRLLPRLPMTGPLGWLDGSTWADELERERIDTLSVDKQPTAWLLHERAIHFRCIRTTPVPCRTNPDSCQ